MTELIGKLLAAIPAYVRQLIDLLKDPREFIEKIDLDSDDALKEALTFLAISFGLVFIAEIPLLPQKQNKEILFGVSAVLAAVSFTVSVLLLLVSWKIVGGKLTFKKFITVTSYFTSVSSLLLLIFTLVGVGIFNGIDPENAQLLRNDGYADPVDLMKSAGYRALWLVIALGFVVAFIWIFRMWRTYRELNQVSRARSVIAFLIFAVLSPVAIALQFAMAAGLSGATPPHFPAELVGLWEVTRDNRSNDAGTHSAMTLNFNSMGYYFMLITKGTTNGKCYVMITDGSNGHATVSGTGLTLHVSKHTETSNDTCNNTKSEFAKDTNNEVYQYEIRQSSDGQQLCLTGKLGEACMKPKKQ
jgi:hypothetical protein